MLVRYINAYLLFPILEKLTKRDILSKRAELYRFNRLSFEQKNSIRKSEFYRALRHAKQNVPFYTDLFRKHAFDEEKVLKDIRYIQDLPTINKDIIRAEWERIRLPGARHARKTGGSTGQSVFFYYDDIGLDWTAAVNMVAYDMSGNYPHKLDCHICSELGIKAVTLKDKFIGGMKTFSQNRRRLMISSFSDHDMRETFAHLSTMRPYLLQGHPSSGYAIAKYIEGLGSGKRKYCDIFEPSGEMLTQKMVDTMEEYLGCRVVNRYGNAEFGVMAHSRMTDSYNRLQVFDRLFYVEDVEDSSLIVSNCTNYSFPLFRYDTGDIGTVRQAEEGTFLSDLKGRVHDLVNIDGQNYATHFLQDYLDHKVKGVREFQIFVSEWEHPTLAVVAEHESDKDRIFKAIMDRWPRGLVVKFVEMDSLVRVGWQQKFRHIVDMGSSSES
ncbi:hypothetical protein [Bdellovibrio bacteriovorus]|uniref:hypothetical protein n=1 Tax=Bdellovibrio bacteriovorus TaxID=959 RepID=UPI0035A59420